MKPLGGLGANRYEITKREIKNETRERLKSLRASVMVDGRPPGTVPVRDAGRQRQILEGLVANGRVLTPSEQRRLAKLSEAPPLIPPLQ